MLSNTVSDFKDCLPTQCSSWSPANWPLRKRLHPYFYSTATKGGMHDVLRPYSKSMRKPALVARNIFNQNYTLQSIAKNGGGPSSVTAPERQKQVDLCELEFY